MAIFIKLTNGDVVNTQHIKSIKRHKEIEPGAFREALRKGSRDSETGEYRIVSAPAIQILLGNDVNPLTLKYESEQARDTEFERLESMLLQPQAMVTFGSLVFTPMLVQSINVDWASFSDTSLELRIKMPGLRRLLVTVHRNNQDEWERCMNLLAQFNMQLPPVPEW